MELVIPFAALVAIAFTKRSNREGLIINREKHSRDGLHSGTLSGKQIRPRGEEDMENIKRQNMAIMQVKAYNQPGEFKEDPAEISVPPHQIGLFGYPQTEVNYPEHAPAEDKEASSDPFISLSGNTMTEKDIKHNNMQPFFGANVKQGNNHSAQVMDRYTGDGSHYIKKKEIAPMFSPQSNMANIHGTPNQADLIKERINPSHLRTNEKPFEQKRVGPSSLGLGDDGIQGVGGFNAGMMGRDSIMPKSVDDLRVRTNPKVSFEGQILNPVSKIVERGIQGAVEKNRPDTYYETSPERGYAQPVNKGPTSRATSLLKPENRLMTTAEHYGNPENYKSGYTTGKYEESRRPHLDANIKHITNAYAPTHNVESQNLQNFRNSQRQTNRDLTENNDIFGSVSSTFKSMISPITDVLKPTRKEDYVDKSRIGNPTSSIYGMHIRDPCYIAKETIREQTEKDTGHRFIGNQADTYARPNIQIHGQQRDTAQHSHIMGAARGNTQMRNYTAEYNANTVDKTTTLQSRDPTPSGVKMLNHDMNMSSRKDDKTFMCNPISHIPYFDKSQSGPVKELYGKESKMSNFSQIDSIRRIQQEQRLDNELIHKGFTY